MIKCQLQGLYVGVTNLQNRNSNTTSRCYDIYDIQLKQTFQLFRCDIEFKEGQFVDLPCELRLRQSGTPYFVYCPPDAQQAEDINKK